MSTTQTLVYTTQCCSNFSFTSKYGRFWYRYKVIAFMKMALYWKLTSRSDCTLGGTPCIMVCHSVNHSKYIGSYIKIY